jgi:hypothetical protein|nr:hypothetical protein [Brucella anthropi]
MDIQKVQLEVNRLQVAMAAKGKSRSDVLFSVRSHEEYRISLHWLKHDPRHPHDTECEVFLGRNPEEVISDARQFIADFPSAEETKFREFMGALGRVIDLGRNNGIDVDFINPLTETMKRLSKNALTDQRKSEGA